MKQLAGLCLCAVMTVFSCKKSNITPPDLTGTWNWNSTYSDSALGPTNPQTPANSGITKSLSFKNGDWSFTQNGVTVLEGGYSTSVLNSTYGKPANRIQYVRKNQTDSVTYYSISGDSLIFSYDLSGTVGSGVTFYIRQ